MKVLVAVADYPNNSGKTAMMFAHVRNKVYIKNGIDVTVLNFAADKDYKIDNIPVCTLNTYKTNKSNYDILIIHSANIRNHYVFLKKYGKSFNHFIFFFHGHEIVKINEVYPFRYDYINDNHIKRLLQNIYDSFKLKVWRKYYVSVENKSDFIFVSKSLYKDFIHYVRTKNKIDKKRIHIINNGIGEVFENKTYNIRSKKEYDFITIRSNMDSSVYCIDLLCKLAEELPKRKFLLIGKGEWFEYNKKPNNICWINKSLRHEEMLEFIDLSKAALMLTRRDSQGVMSCELSSYGIPLITSNLDVCKEMFGKMRNVIFVDNSINGNDLEKEYLSMLDRYEIDRNKKFFSNNTVMKEVVLLRGYK